MHSPAEPCTSSPHIHTHTQLYRTLVSCTSPLSPAAQLNCALVPLTRPLAAQLKCMSVPTPPVPGSPAERCTGSLQPPPLLLAAHLLSSAPKRQCLPLLLLVDSQAAGKGSRKCPRLLIPPAEGGGGESAEHSHFYLCSDPQGFSGYFTAAWGHQDRRFKIRTVLENSGWVVSV